MTPPKDALARIEPLACDTQQQSANDAPVLDQHAVVRKASLFSIVPKSSVKMLKVNSKHLLFAGDERLGLVEVFEAFTDEENVPQVWVRFLGGRHVGAMKKFKLVTNSNNPGWYDSVSEPKCAAGYYCVKHSGVIFHFR